jgi:nicotinamidase-related amidase
MQKMSFQDTALLVIDVQESFRHRHYFDANEIPRYIKAQQALIDHARAAGFAVVQIFHCDDDPLFVKGSSYVRTFEGINIQPDVTIEKSRHSAFIGTPLDIWLREHGIDRLIVSGIRTEQCCETTTRNASDLGYSVNYVTEATLTFAMTHADGTIFSPEDIRKRTELVLSGRFARICTVDDVINQTGKAAA